MNEVINLTGLAKTYKMPTPKMAQKLTEAGVMPLQEIQMPSGRKFVLFDKVKSIKALEEHKAKRERESEKAAKASVTALKAAPKTENADTKALRAEIAELTRTVNQLLEVVTKPKKQDVK